MCVLQVLQRAGFTVIGERPASLPKTIKRAVIIQLLPLSLSSASHLSHALVNRFHFGKGLFISSSHSSTLTHSHKHLQPTADILTKQCYTSHCAILLISKNHYILYVLSIWVFPLVVVFWESSCDNALLTADVYIQGSGEDFRHLTRGRRLEEQND